MKRIIIASLCLILVLSMTGCEKETTTIGIIGGTDGPTSILVTDNTSMVTYQSVQLSQIDMNCLHQITEFMNNPEIRGFSGNDPMPILSDLISNLKIISPNDSNAVCLISGVSLTGFGLVDGTLHIQIKYDDILNTDNHGRVWLKGRDGSVIQSENTVSFWAENQKDSYYEYIFPTLDNCQNGYEVWGEFWTS